MQAITPICVGCSRFRESDQAHPEWWCAAFPDGIPWQIGEDGFDHRKPFPGDHGILFDLAEGDDEFLAEWEADYGPGGTYADVVGTGAPPSDDVVA
jgi:hypothetical protein